MKNKLLIFLAYIPFFFTKNSYSGSAVACAAIVGNSSSSYSSSSNSHEAIKKNILIEKENSKFFDLMMQILRFSSEELEKLSPTILNEAASIGSFQAFIKALEKGANFDISYKECLLMLIQFRMEYYKENDIGDENLLSQAKLLKEYIEYLCFIKESIDSIIMPDPLKNIIFSFCYGSAGDGKHFEFLYDKKNQKSKCIIS